MPHLKETGYQKNFELQAIIDGFEDGIAVIDKNSKIRRLNLSMLAFSEKNNFPLLIDKKCHNALYGFADICHFCPLKENSSHFSTLEQEDFNHTQEIVLYQKDTLVGKKVFFHHLYVIRSREDQYYIIEVIRDITARKKQEEENLRNEKLVALGTIVQTVAHELQNPLTGMSFLLQKMLREETSQDKRKSLELLQKDLNIASSIVTDIHNVHRHKTYYLEPLQIRSIVQESYEKVLRIKPIKHKLSFDWECNEEIEILGNERRLQQAFTNLFSNALDAFDFLPNEEKNRASLWIIARTTHEILQKEQCLVLTIQVIDNGGGIRESEIRRVFDPYFTTKKLKLRMGLGLYVVNRIVEEHAGKIEVDSKGIFTRFLLKFPLEQEGRKYSGALHDGLSKK